jgi:hypothetical protein
MKFKLVILFKCTFFGYNEGKKLHRRVLELPVCFMSAQFLNKLFTSERVAGSLALRHCLMDPTISCSVPHEWQRILFACSWKGRRTYGLSEELRANPGLQLGNAYSFRSLIGLRFHVPGCSWTWAAPRASFGSRSEEGRWFQKLWAWKTASAALWATGLVKTSPRVGPLSGMAAMVTSTDIMVPGRDSEKHTRRNEDERSCDVEKD